MEMYTAEELLIISDIGHECVMEMTGTYSNFLKKIKALSDNSAISPQMLFYPLTLLMVNIFMQIKQENADLRRIFVEFIEAATPLIEFFEENKGIKLK